MYFVLVGCIKPLFLNRAKKNIYILGKRNKLVLLKLIKGGLKITGYHQNCRQEKEILVRLHGRCLGKKFERRKNDEGGC